MKLIGAFKDGAVFEYEIADYADALELIGELNDRKFLIISGKNDEVISLCADEIRAAVVIP